MPTSTSVGWDPQAGLCLQSCASHQPSPLSSARSAHSPPLLQLTAKAKLNKYVRTIALPKTSSYLPRGSLCTIAGWGLIDEDQITGKLFETKVSIYSRRKCVLFYPHLDDGMVCAGSFHELKDSSQVWPWGGGASRELPGEMAAHGAQPAGAALALGKRMEAMPLLLGRGDPLNGKAAPAGWS